MNSAICFDKFEDHCKKKKKNHFYSIFSILPQVAPPTPLRENSCPRPPPAPEGVVLNEVASGHWTNHSQQRSFVELRGPPLTELRGLVLVVFDQEHGGRIVALPLTGFIDDDGYYTVGNVTEAGEHRQIGWKI